MLYWIMAIVAVLLVVASAPAHEFWIQPDTYRPGVDSVVKVGLRVGDGFPGEPVSRNAKRIVQFIARGPGGEADILGVEGSDPAGLLKVTQPGLIVLGYRSNRASIELEAEKFEAYLRDEGLDAIIEQRKQRGEAGKAGREVYSRCAKAILQAGESEKAPPGSKSTFDTPLGHTLELIPEQDPAALKVGDTLAVRLLLEGRPLVNALVEATSPVAGANAASGRTDADGRVRLTLSHAGMWLFASVHMMRAPADANADWESFWASLTLEIANGAPAKTTGAP